MQISSQLNFARLTQATAAEARLAIRGGEWVGPTAGLARGYVQLNLVILPQAEAAEFAEFCALNPRPCPLIVQTKAGDPCPASIARGADLRTDVPSYRVFRRGVCDAVDPTDISHVWRDDLVGFLLGCSFTFDEALVEAGVPVRHLEERRNAPMYRTTLECHRAGRFSGKMVVTMRPLLAEQIGRAVEITSQFPTMHGAAIHFGDPSSMGIKDLTRPDFGEAVTIRPDEIPVFWACGVTSLVAIYEAQCELAITHSPGCMFISDLKQDDVRKPAEVRESLQQKPAKRPTGT